MLCEQNAASDSVVWTVICLQHPQLQITLKHQSTLSSSGESRYGKTTFSWTSYFKGFKSTFFFNLYQKIQCMGYSMHSSSLNMCSFRSWNPLSHVLACGRPRGIPISTAWQLKGSLLTNDKVCSCVKGVSNNNNTDKSGV